MSRLAIAGVALSVSGLIGLLSLELIGTAHAARQADKGYLVAISNGPALFLVRNGASGGDAGTARQLACGRLFAVGELRLGLQCRHHVRSGI